MDRTAHLEVHFSHEQKAAHLFNFAFGHMTTVQDTACWMQQYVKGWPYIRLNQSRRKCSFFHVQLRDSNSFFCSVAQFLLLLFKSDFFCGYVVERERERRKGWKSAEQMNEQSVVWHQGRVDCSVESRDRRRKRKPTDALGLLCTGEAR